jgi:DNA-binding transcriptional ArsR family regulator
MTEPRKAVLIITEPKIIRLLANLVNSEILSLLIKKPMTETQISKVLELAKASVGYHLQPLKHAELIKIDRFETEEHGISKYYTASANLFIVDPDRIPRNAKRYFLEREIIRLEAMLSVLKFFKRISNVTSKDLEDLANSMLRQLKIVGQKHTNEKVNPEDAESSRIEIYAEALNNLLKQKEYHMLFKQ